MSDVIELPGDTGNVKIVPLVNWIYRIQRSSNRFQIWHENLYKNKGEQFPIYKWTPATNEQITPLSNVEACAHWQLIYKCCLVSRTKPGVFDAMVRKAADEGHTYVDLRDIAAFSKGSGIANPYATSESRPSANLVIGALCDLYWRSQYPKIPEIVQKTIIGDLVAGGIRGLGDRTLKDILPDAIKAFKEAKEKKESK